MKEIKRSELLKIIYMAVSRTYFKDIVKNTPGRGIVRDGWELIIENDGIYVVNEEFGDIIIFLEEGTAPHTIRPKNAQALRWKTGEGDKFAFAKVVHHPGIEAREFVKKALSSSKNKKEFEKIVIEELEKFL